MEAKKSKIMQLQTHFKLLNLDTVYINYRFTYIINVKRVTYLPHTSNFSNEICHKKRNLFCNVTSYRTYIRFITVFS